MRADRPVNEPPHKPSSQCPCKRTLNQPISCWLIPVDCLLTRPFPDFPFMNFLTINWDLRGRLDAQLDGSAIDADNLHHYLTINEGAFVEFEKLLPGRRCLRGRMDT